MRIFKRFFGAATLALVLASSACAAGSGEVDRSGLALGTICSIRILSGGSEKALDDAFARLAAIEASMSANQLGTLVSDINEQAGGAPVKVPEDLLYVTGKALWYARHVRADAFDPTIGPVVKLWNIGLDGERIPSAQEIAAALPLVDFRAVQVDENGRNHTPGTPGHAAGPGRHRQGLCRRRGGAHPAKPAGSRRPS